MGEGGAECGTQPVKDARCWFGIERGLPVEIQSPRAGEAKFIVMEGGMAFEDSQR